MDFIFNKDKSSLPLINDLIPYGIIILNIFIFKLLRSLTIKIINYFSIEQKQNIKSTRSNNNNNNQKISLLLSEKLKFFKLLINELISTCELCADCFELNVIYEKHGSLAYGIILFLLTYLWLDSFGEAHTTPGYLIEDYFLFKGNKLFLIGETYARFLGQSFAIPLSFKFASFYWSFKLLTEHSEFLEIKNCKSSLTTNIFNGFLIELICCFICRLIELIFQDKLSNTSSKVKSLNSILSYERIFNILNSFISTFLVVLALDISGGYFNPILASSLEFSCKGTSPYEHTIVFWFGPLIGHLLARQLFIKYLKLGNKSQLYSNTKIEQQSNQRSTKINKNCNSTNLLANQTTKTSPTTINVGNIKTTTTITQNNNRRSTRLNSITNSKKND